MDLTHKLLHAFRSPAYVFHHRPLQEYAKDMRIGKADSPSLDAPDLLNRVPPPDVADTASWRVDGATVCGTRFFCVPVRPAIGLVPTRIDVYIPDQAEHPLILRHTLASHAVTVSRDMQGISDSGIANYIGRVLKHHTLADPGWLETYLRSPFASSIVFENLSMDITNVKVSLVSSYQLERQALTVRRLQTIWSSTLSKDPWPPIVDLESLRLVKQLHESVSIVKVVSELGSWPDLLVFKSSTDDLAHLYHEMRFLLTMTPHQYIMPRPLGIVTKAAKFGNKQGVVGFLLPYYPLGSVGNLIPQAMKAGTLRSVQQIQIVQQVLAALIHVVEQQKTFYSDLRLDNVLIDRTGNANNRGSDPLSSPFNVVLCDFEQRGNWYEWCASEILYPQYCQSLSRHHFDDGHANPWGGLVATYKSLCPSNSPPSVDPAVFSANTPWFRLPKSSAEKAMTYSFGLFMYCIFEGLPNPCLNIANAYPHESDIEFPQFRSTPLSLQQLITDCTIDAPDRSHGCHMPTGRRSAGLIRKGHKVYPNDCDDLERQQNTAQSDIENLVLDNAYHFWVAELEKAKAFMERSETSQDMLGSKRPTLREVQQALRHIQHELLPEHATVLAS